ncbi:MAG: NAD(P)H-dependent oxidoreductase [Dehalococcoidia bacterium]|nr:NAD(P)H-dependent oxidoreductase [Dehalococcoidia bacterium]MDD5494308.1 NAD(P)H-dependent oxidoreductase [Dehalococcoidia bacterium]
MEGQIRILGFAGSLRSGSYNRALLRAAAELIPEKASLEIFDLERIPPFNQDLENAMPEKVREFKSKIRAADAVLIVTPEYNYSVPGVLKNAIDWASRPYGDSVWPGKPVALMSASTGMLGGSRAQYHLRQSFIFLDVLAVTKPEVFVTFAAQKFDDKGKLIDESTRKVVRDLLNTLTNLAQNKNQ